MRIALQHLSRERFSKHRYDYSHCLYQKQILMQTKIKDSSSGPISAQGPVEVVPFATPNSFLHPPRPAVVLLGDPHLHILLTSSPSLCSALSFSSADLGHTFPLLSRDCLSSEEIAQVSPSSRNRGILETSWIEQNWRKCVANVVIFFDLKNYEQTPWEQVEEKIVSLVQRFRERNPVGDRVFREIVVVASSDVYFTETCTNLASTWRKCGLSNRKDVFFFSVDSPSEHLPKLEVLVKLKSNEYFKQRIKHIKKARDSLVDSSPKHLYIRWNIQLALLHMTISDLDLSLYYFREAYKSLLQSERTQASEYQVKHLSYLITFFVVAIFMKSDRFSDAIEFFSKNVESFSRIISPEMEFRHYRWMTLQYEMFAEILKTCVSSRSSIDRQHHPTYYYHLASIHLKMERDLFHAVGNTLGRTSQLYSVLKERKYFGCISPQEYDKTMEQEVSIWQEGMINHSLKLIDLLKKAYASTRSFHSPRMIAFIGREIAQEYMSTQQFEQAKPFFENLLQSYRVEKWNTLLIAALKNLIVCCRELGHYEDLVTYSLELLGMDHGMNPEHAQILEEEILILIQNFSDKSSGSSPVEFNIVSNSLIISAQYSFNVSQTECDSEFSSNICITSLFSKPLEILTLHLSSTDSLAQHRISDQKMILSNSTPLQFSQALCIKSSVDNFQLTELKLVLADSPNCIFSIPLRSLSGRGISIQSKAPVVSMSCEFHQPALLQEYFEIKCKVTVDSLSVAEPEVCFRIETDVKCTPSNTSVVVYAWDNGTQAMIPLEQSELFLQTFSNAVLSLSKSLKFSLFVYSQNANSAVFRLNVKSAQTSKILSTKRIAIPFVDPFKVEFSRFFANQIPISNPSSKSTLSSHSVMLDSVAFFHVNVINSSPHSISVNNVCLNLQNEFLALCPDELNDEQNQVLKPEESSTFMFSVVGVCAGIADVNSVSLTWSKTNETDLALTNVYVSILPAIDIPSPPVTANVSYSPSCQVGECVHMILRVDNYSEEEQIVSFKMEKSPDFMFSGKRSGSIHVLPQTSELVQFGIIALSAGCKTMPKLAIINENTLENLLPDSNTGSIYAFPNHEQS